MSPNARGYYVCAHCGTTSFPDTVSRDGVRILGPADPAINCSFCNSPLARGSARRVSRRLLRTLPWTAPRATRFRGAGAAAPRLGTGSVGAPRTRGHGGAAPQDQLPQVRHPDDDRLVLRSRQRRHGSLRRVRGRVARLRRIDANRRCAGNRSRLARGLKGGSLAPLRSCKYH